MPIYLFLVNLHKQLDFLGHSHKYFLRYILLCFLFFYKHLKFLLVCHLISLHPQNSLMIEPTVLIYLLQICLKHLLEILRFLSSQTFFFLDHLQRIHNIELLCMGLFHLLQLMLIMKIGTNLYIGHFLLDISLLGSLILFQQGRFDVQNLNQTKHPLCLFPS